MTQPDFTLQRTLEFATAASCLAHSIVGDCNLEGTVVVEEGGLWRGNITALNVIIAGEVHGEVIGHKKIELAQSAKIVGTLTGPTLAIAEGAVIEGSIKMTSGTTPVRFVDKRGE